MKRNLIAASSLLLAWRACAGQVNIVVNGREIETSAIESNGAFYVPIETLGKALGATVIIRSNEAAASITPPPAAATPPVTTEVSKPAPAPPSSMTTIQLSTPPAHAVGSIKGVLRYKVTIMDSRGIDAGAHAWLVPAAQIGALAAAAGGTAEEPVPQRAVGWDTKLSEKFSFSQAIADERGEFSFASVVPGAYMVVLVSKHTNSLAARDRKGKIRFKRIVVREAETTDASFNFGMSSLPVEDNAAPSPPRGSSS